MSNNEPTAGRVERRLATILVADVYGYSRMIGENEERTLRNLHAHRAVFDDILNAHRGRIFNTAGDAVLAEFPSAVEAVRAATEIQAALRTRNEHLPEEERLWFRIGVNLGDVVVQNGDLLGDGVNVAARIQTAAEPGGVCISGSVYDQIQNKLTLNITKLGERSFKNIAQPVRTFAIGDGSGKAVRVVPVPSAMRRIVIGAGIAVALLAAAAIGAYLWRDHAHREAEAAMQARKATEEQQAKLAAELKAAKDALAAADAEKAKREAAEREAKAAAEREAKQAADLKAAKDAKDAAAKAAAAAAAAAAGTTAPTKAAAAAPAAKSVVKFDGLYQGRICKAVSRGTNARCWNTAMTVQNGAVSMSWKTTVLGKPDHAQGTVSSTGDVALTLESGEGAGNSTPGRMTGRFVDKAITLTGTWGDGASGNATLEWAPDRGKK